MIRYSSPKLQTCRPPSAQVMCGGFCASSSSSSINGIPSPSRSKASSKESFLLPPYWVGVDYGRISISFVGDEVEVAVKDSVEVSSFTMGSIAPVVVVLLESLKVGIAMDVTKVDAKDADVAIACGSKGPWIIVTRPNGAVVSAERIRVLCLVISPVSSKVLDGGGGLAPF